MPSNPQYDREIKKTNMKALRTPPTRMRYLLGNNPTGELIRILSRAIRYQTLKRTNEKVDKD